MEPKVTRNFILDLETLLSISFFSQIIETTEPQPTPLVSGYDIEDFTLVLDYYYYIDNK